MKKVPAKIIITMTTIIVIIAVGIASYEGYLYYKDHKSIQDNIKAEAASKQKMDQDIAKKRQEEEAAKQKQQEEAANKEKELENLYQQGYTAYNNHDYQQAIQIEDKVIGEDPNFYKAYTIKGIAQCFSSNHDYTGGMKNLDKALQIKSDYGYGMYNKALAFELYGYYDKAIEEYKKALQVEQFTWSYYGIASIYGRRGDVENSVKYLKLAISVSDSPELVKDAAKNEVDYNNVKNSKEFQGVVNN